MTLKEIFIILIHAVIGWLLCAGTMGVGMAILSLQKTLIVHAVGAPVFFSVISLFYFKRFGHTTPFRLALIFVCFIMLVDFFVVALLINQSLDMFKSLLGTWIPFGLIFISTFLTGVFVKK